MRVLKFFLFRRKMKNVCISQLIRESQYVQTKCLNVSYVHELWGKVWHHKLPLKNENNHFLEPSNWDLPEPEIARIQRAIEKLNDYTEIVFSLVYSLKGKPVKDSLNSVTDLLPPWIVFPLYHVSCLGWRMGNGEEYQNIYISFIRSLSEDEFSIYSKSYPVPEYMVPRFSSIRQPVGTGNVK